MVDDRKEDDVEQFSLCVHGCCLHLSGYRAEVAGLVCREHCRNVLLAHPTTTLHLTFLVAHRNTNAQKIY